MTLRNNFRATKKFLIVKFECVKISCVEQSNFAFRAALEFAQRVEYLTFSIDVKFDQNTRETKQRGGVIGHQLEYFRYDGLSLDYLRY